MRIVSLKGIAFESLSSLPMPDDDDEGAVAAAAAAEAVVVLFDI